MPEDVTKKHFFISRTGSDAAWAQWIAWQLEKNGYDVVVQDWDFGPGVNFLHSMQKALVETERTIALLSPRFFESDFTEAEWTAVYRQDPTGEKGLLLPIRLENFEPPGLFGPRTHFDLFKFDETIASRELLGWIKRALVSRGKPGKAPAFPGTSAGKKATGTTKDAPNFPRNVPPIFKLPQRNRNFTGRDELIARLRNSLTSGNTAAVTAAVHGLGGVGKSELAIEYAWRWASHYSTIIWIRAETAATLAADFEALGDKLNLFNGNKPSEQAAVIEIVREHLLKNSGWLLVLDNAEKPNDIEHATPRSGGQVIITSRYTAWGKVAQPLPVDVWPPEEAQQFLLKRVGAAGTQTEEADRAAAAGLAKELGYLPLALEHAAAYCEQVELSPSDYLNLFRENRLELFRPEALGTEAGESEAVTVSTTWNISLNRIRESENCPEAADLFNVCAFFGPDWIPLRIIREGAAHLPGALASAVDSDLKINNALAALLRYSLISVEASGPKRTISIHRLVQEVTRERLSDAGREQWAGVAACVVSEAFPGDSNDVRVWPICGPLETHAEQSAGHAENLAVEPNAAARLLNQLALYVWARAEYGRAKGYFKRAIGIVERQFGESDSRVATTVNNLGLVLRDQGDLEGAKACFERALKIAEAAFGPDHPEVAIDVNNLGLVLRTEGDLEGAKACYERALKIGEATLGHDHPSVAIRVNNLGGVLEAQGDLEGAKACYERALKIDEAAFGPDHPEVATDVNNIGGVLRTEGDLEGAKACFERALKINEAAFGADHPNVAMCLNNLGVVIEELGDSEGGKSCYERALKIDEAAFGPDHPNVARDLANLGDTLEALGDLEGAKACFERALRIFRQFLGDEHPRTKNVRGHLENLGGL